MRPMLHPGLRRVWRAPDTVQFGVDVVDPIVFTGVDDQAATLMAMLDGSCEVDDVIERSAAAGHDRYQARQTLSALLASGVVVDATDWPGCRTLTKEARTRLAPDLRARTLPTAGGPALSNAADAAASCERVAGSAVRLHGLGRLGAVIATMLTVSGVGRVDVVDNQPVDQVDLSAGGHEPASVGKPRAGLIQRLLPWRATTDQNQPIVLDVVTDAADARVVATELSRDHRPHLIVSALESVSRIGPLVQPGRSTCLRCYDLSLADHDAGWPQIALQREPAIATVASDGALVGATAAVAVMHVLDWLVGGRPPSVNGVVELTRPHATMTVRAVSPHPACGCQWSNRPAEETMAS